MVPSTVQLGTSTHYEHYRLQLQYSRNHDQPTLFLILQHDAIDLTERTSLLQNP